MYISTEVKTQRVFSTDNRSDNLHDHHRNNLKSRIKYTVVWYVTPCILVEIYQRFGRTDNLYARTRCLQNYGKLPPECRASHSRLQF